MIFYWISIYIKKFQSSNDNMNPDTYRIIKSGSALNWIRGFAFCSQVKGSCFNAIPFHLTYSEINFKNRINNLNFFCRIIILFQIQTIAHGHFEFSTFLIFKMFPRITSLAYKRFSSFVSIDGLDVILICSAMTARPRN